MCRNDLLVFFIALVFLVCSGSAFAASENGRPQYQNQDGDWTVRIGAIGLYKPEYEGSDDYSVAALPLVDITWRDTFFLNPRKGLGAYVLKRENIKLAVSLGYTFGRDEDDSSDLDGLGDIDAGATANVFAEWALSKINLNAHYEKQITGENTGVQAHFSLGYMLRAGKVMFKPSLQTTYANSEYMETFFGVSPGQSTGSGLSVYNPSSGFKTVGVNLMAIYRLTQKWGVQGMAGYKRLVGDAADSPIVKDKDQYLFGTGISYSF